MRMHGTFTLRNQDWSVTLTSRPAHRIGGGVADIANLSNIFKKHYSKKSLLSMSLANYPWGAALPPRQIDRTVDIVGLTVEVDDMSSRDVMLTALVFHG